MKNFLRPILAVTFAALLVASATIPADAARRAGARSARTIYDGLWTVSIVTLYGDCDRSYRYPLRIVAGRAVNADENQDFQIYGAVGRGGAASVTVARGGQSATGYGHLTRNSGHGRWRTSTGQCSGQWTAMRRPSAY